MALPFPFDAAFVVGHAATADERGDGSHTSSPLLISGDASVRLWTPEDFARLAVRSRRAGSDQEKRSDCGFSSAPAFEPIVERATVIAHGPSSCVLSLRYVRTWTRAQLRHVGRLWRFSTNPAATVYDSLGADFFLAPAPGWLNLGLWEGPGDEAEAAVAPRRLVETMAGRLPRGGVILDVGNGLGAQDPVIAEVALPHTLVALNITESQLHAGRFRLAEASGHPVVGDATRIPLGDGTVDAVISVEAAFHFPSRPAFFAEVGRVLRPGGRLVMSDISTERLPRTAAEVLAGATSLRFWGLGLAAAASATVIRQQACDAGLVDVRVERIGRRVFEPMLRWAASKVQRVPAPRSQRWAARLMLAQWSLLRRRGLLDYILLEATAPPPAP